MVVLKVDSNKQEGVKVILSPLEVGALCMAIRARGVDVLDHQVASILDEFASKLVQTL